jgi:hypothetical protein
MITLSRYMQIYIQIDYDMETMFHKYGIVDKYKIDLGFPNIADSEIYDKAKLENGIQWENKTHWVQVASALFYLKIFTNFDRHVTDTV